MKVQHAVVQSSFLHVKNLTMRRQVGFVHPHEATQIGVPVTQQNAP
jgi:hypothetical protein